jgi:HKD family nuclease
MEVLIDALKANQICGEVASHIGREQDMPAVEVLFDEPQSQISRRLTALIDQCLSARIVVGFATVDGVEAIFSSFRQAPSKLQQLVVGAATFRAFQAFDKLIEHGVPKERLRIHLGHTRLTTSSGARYKFLRYHPMLHSKIYCFEMVGRKTVLVIGSHNLTNFAMNGLNGEASVLIECDSSDSQVLTVENHINEAWRQAIEYEEGMKEALAWWTTQFMEGMADKFDDSPREGTYRPTFILLVYTNGPQRPAKGEVIYFELPRVLAVNSMHSEFHIYVFASKPPSGRVALKSLKDAKVALRCSTSGLEINEGGLELKADWRVGGRMDPILTKVSRGPFRPQPVKGMQQVRVEVTKRIRADFEYLFGKERKEWLPKLSDIEAVEGEPEEMRALRSLDIVPPEDGPWSLVQGLAPTDPTKEDSAYRAELITFSPESEADGYFFYSVRRKARSKIEEEWANEDE